MNREAQKKRWIALGLFWRCDQCELIITRGFRDSLDDAAWRHQRRHMDSALRRWMLVIAVCAFVGVMWTLMLHEVR